MPTLYIFPVPEFRETWKFDIILRRKERHRTHSGMSTFKLSCLYRFEHGSRPSGYACLCWTHSGYPEIQNPPKRYGIIDLRELSSLCGFGDVATFQQAHRRWVDDSLAREAMAREGRWSEAIAVGNLNFFEKVQNELGYKAAHRHVIESGGIYELGSRLKVTGPILAVK